MRTSIIPFYCSHCFWTFWSNLHWICTQHRFWGSPRTKNWLWRPIDSFDISHRTICTCSTIPHTVMFYRQTIRILFPLLLDTQTNKQTERTFHTSSLGSVETLRSRNTVSVLSFLLTLAFIPVLWVERSSGARIWVDTPMDAVLAGCALYVGSSILQKRGARKTSVNLWRL